jgi:hypothetical protein
MPVRLLPVTKLKCLAYLPAPLFDVVIHPLYRRIKLSQTSQHLEAATPPSVKATSSMGHYRGEESKYQGLTSLQHNVENQGGDIESLGVQLLNGQNHASLHDMRCQMLTGIICLYIRLMLM